MMLRNHPKVADHWPPNWSAWYGRGDKIPTGEESERLISAKDKDDTIVLEVEYEGNKCNGYLFIEDEDFRSRLLDVLKQNLGRSIKEIASVNLDF